MTSSATPPSRDEKSSPMPLHPAAPNAAYRSPIGNIVVPLLPVVLAFLVACAARHYAENSLNTGMNMAASTDAPPLSLNSTAPDFTLTNVHGGAVTLSEITKTKPVLLIFYLGYSCPRCVAHLREIASRIDEFHKLGAEVLAISPDTVAESKDSIATYGDFPFPMLSDPQMKVARSYNLVAGEDTLFHGAFVVDTSNRIRLAVKSSHPYDNSDALLAALRDAQYPPK